MIRPISRHTLASSARIEGFGLHSGSPVEVALHPGQAGVRFLHLGQWIVANPEAVTDTRRCTTLGTVGTVEHLMSTLSALEVTDIDIEVTGPELPGLGGASLGYVEVIRSVGLESLGEMELEGPFARVFSVHEGSKVGIATGEGRWHYEFDLGAMGLGVQSVEFALDDDTYAHEVAPCRTTVFEQELPHIQALGLGQGLTKEDVVVIAPGGYVAKARFEDEPARHKLLDLIGDLYLAGVPCKYLNVSASKSGHTANVQAAAKLAAHTKLHRPG